MCVDLHIVTLSASEESLRQGEILRRLAAPQNDMNITCWQNERLPLLNQEAQQIRVVIKRCLSS